MARFVVRRLVAMVLVLFADLGAHVRDLQRDPGRRPGACAWPGATPNHEQIERDPQGVGLRRAGLRPVRQDDGEGLHRRPRVLLHQLNVIDEIKKRIPRTFALAIGAAILWMVFATALGLFTAMRAGQFSDRFLTVLALVGISMPVFWIGALMNYYLGFKWGIFPNGGYVAVRGQPLGVVLPPDHALDGAVDAVHRRLLARSCARTSSTRSTTTTCAPRGPRGCPSARCMVQARAAQLDDPDRHAVGARLRRGARRRRDPHRDRLRPPGRGPVRRRVDRRARRAPGARHHDVRRVLHRAAEHGRGHRLRGARPEDPARRERRAAARGRGPRGLVRDRGGHGAGRRRRVVRPRAGRDPGDRRRVGLRQVGHGDDADGADPLAERRASEGTARVQGHRAGRRLATRSCARSAARRSR